MINRKLAPPALALGLAASAASATVLAGQDLLNVSYDVSRNFYKELNPAFVEDWKAKTGEAISINQSHGGSGKQARAVIDGLDADVVTMNSALDINAIVDKSHFIRADWAKQFPHEASPSWSAILFVVRKGNPRGIKDWGDLVKPGVSVVIPNPKTSGNGRYSYLSAWEWARRQNGGSEDAAKDFVGRLFANVPVLDTGGRGATTTFSQRGIGDVLLTFENEVNLIVNELGGKFEVVVPSLTARADNPVAIVDKVASKKGTNRAAKAYLEFHYSKKAQEIFANNFIRPENNDVLREHSQQFPALNTFDVAQAFGGWPQAQAKHFSDGGTFDQIYLKK